MHAIAVDDVIETIGTGIAGIAVPASLVGLPPERLRFDGHTIVDAASITTWHIDGAGRKRLAAAPDRQSLDCAWDARLVQIEGVWRVRVAADDLLPHLDALWAKATASGTSVDIADPGTPSIVVLAATDASGKADLLGMKSAAALGLPLVWYQSTGPIAITAAQLDRVALAVHAHVENQIRRWSETRARIVSGELTTAAAVEAAFAA